MRVSIPRQAIRRFASHSRAHPSRGLAPFDPVGFVTAFLTFQPEEKTMPFKQIGPEQLDERIMIRLTTAEKEQLKEDAKIANISLSALVRRRYFGRPILAHADAVMLKELRRIGGLLKHLHNESNGAHSKDTSSVLIALKNYFEVLSNGRQKD